MNQADDKTIRQGIEVAERQIAEIDAKLFELKRLTERRAALEAYLAHAKALLGEPQRVAQVFIDTNLLVNNAVMTRRSGTDEKPLWAEVVPVLAQAQRPMSVPQIVEVMKAAGREFGAEHVSEVVRAALNRRPDVFENVSKGKYAIKTWPDEWKKRE